VCFITDLEDGSHPIACYGKTTEEVLQKLALQNAHAQIAIARRSAAPPVSPPSVPAAPRKIQPDQIMRATVDLTDPAKSGQAVATLFESATGISPQRLILENFGAVAEQWERENPEFFAHNGNRRLMAAEAAQLAGGLGQVTQEHLSQAFLNLRAKGDLFEAPAYDPNHQTPPTFPDEIQVQPAERTRPRFATAARSINFRQAAPATRTLKYTAEDIRTMPVSKSRRLIENGDKDYAEACEAYFGSSAQATA
jgi:hypothetical protein